MADRGRNENVPNLLHRADFRNGKSHGPPQSGAFTCLSLLTFFVLETQGLRTFLQTDDVAFLVIIIPIRKIYFTDDCK